MVNPNYDLNKAADEFLSNLYANTDRAKGMFNVVNNKGRETPEKLNAGITVSCNSGYESAFVVSKSIVPTGDFDSQIHLMLDGFAKLEHTEFHGFFGPKGITNQSCSGLQIKIEK